MQTSFSIVLGLAFVVVTLVVGIFFVILTVQKSASLTLLRAIGARTGDLVQALLVQVGVVSRGCGNQQLPNIYTRVSSFSDWIQKTMSEN